jgi:hypothetical protein
MGRVARSLLTLPRIAAIYLALWLVVALLAILAILGGESEAIFASAVIGMVVGMPLSLVFPGLVDPLLSIFGLCCLFDFSSVSLLLFLMCCLIANGVQVWLVCKIWPNVFLFRPWKN